MTDCDTAERLREESRPLLREVEDVRTALRSLDEAVERLRLRLVEQTRWAATYATMSGRTYAGVELRADCSDHLMQIHFLLTSAKGHLHTVRSVLRIRVS